MSDDRVTYRLAAPGRFVDIGGRSLHYQVMGEGSPTVILEAGLAGMGLFFGAVQPRLAEFTRVVAYDRPGLGWSDPAPAPMNGERVVTDLHAMLTKANIPGPYVMVGHSWGGPYIRLFTHHYPAEVAGLVFVDSSHEDQFLRFPKQMGNQAKSTAQVFRLLPWAARLGIMRVVGAITQWRGVWDVFPTEARSGIKTLFNSPWHWQGAYVEARDSEQTAAQVRAIGRQGHPLGDRPVVVVTAGATFQSRFAVPPGVSPTEASRIWLELQTELSQLSSNARHIILNDADHVSIVFKHADAMIAAVRDVVEAARENNPTPAV